MTNKYEKTFPSFSFLIISHYATYGMQDLLFEYMTKQKVKRVTKINFPLPELPYLHRMEITHAENGRIKEKKDFPSLYKPKPLAYLLHCIQLMLWGLSASRVYDIIITEDALLTFIAIILRFFRKCKLVVFYSHGIDNTRFDNAMFLRFYKAIDKFAAIHSDYILVLSQKMIAIREKQGVSRDRIFWVPASIPINSLKRKTSVISNKLVFMGTLNSKNGVYILPKIVQYLKNHGADIGLDIMGDGPDRKMLENQIKELDLTKNIRLLGNLRFEEFADKLTYYQAGIVSYEFSKDNLLQMTDSMKQRVYTAAGLPIVITKGFDFSSEVEKNAVGICVPFGVEPFAKALFKLLTDINLANKMRKTALLYSKKYDLHAFYKRAFARILEDKKI